MSSNNHHEVARITIAIALVATFLTLILSLDKLIPDTSSNLLIIIRLLVYFHFAFICLMFFLYLLFKARTLKYQKDEEDEKVSDLSVCLQFSLLWIFKRKSLKYNRRFLRTKFNNLAKGNYKFYYDEGIRQSFFFPFNMGFYLLINYVPQWLGNFLTINQNWINPIAVFIIGVGYLLISVILNLLRFLITGEQ